MKKNKYKDWELYDHLPEGWRMATSCGSPLTGYAFCVCGSLLTGRKMALVRVEKPTQPEQTRPYLPKSEPPPPISEVSPQPFPALTVQTLARKKFQQVLLQEIQLDLVICQIESWDKTVYIKELQDLINSIKVN